MTIRSVVHQRHKNILSKSSDRSHKLGTPNKLLAVTKRFIALGISHDSFSLEFVGNFIIAASDKQVSIRKPINFDMNNTLFTLFREMIYLIAQHQQKDNCSAKHSTTMTVKKLIISKKAI